LDRLKSARSIGSTLHLLADSHWAGAILRAFKRPSVCLSCRLGG
jgi:hypothetical protein